MMRSNLHSKRCLKLAAGFIIWQAPPPRHHFVAFFNARHYIKSIRHKALCLQKCRMHAISATKIKQISACFTKLVF